MQAVAQQLCTMYSGGKKFVIRTTWIYQLRRNCSSTEIFTTPMTCMHSITVDILCYGRLRQQMADLNSKLLLHLIGTGL